MRAQNIILSRDEKADPRLCELIAAFLSRDREGAIKTICQQPAKTGVTNTGVTNK